MLTPFAARGSTSVTKATLLVLVSAVAFGSISILTIFAAREGLTLLGIVSWRFLFAAGAMAVIARPQLLRHWRAGVPLFLIGGFLQALATYVSLSALRFIPASALTFLFFTYPAWLALTSAARGVEPLTGKRAGILLLAMTGVALMIGIPGVGAKVHLNWAGVALGLGSALLYSAYLPAVEHLQRGIPAIPASFYIILGALVTYLVAGTLLTLRAGTPHALAPPPTASAWVYVLLLAIVSTVLAFLALLRGLRTLGAARTSIIATTEPFFTTMLAVGLLGERLRWTTLVGGACIAAAVIAIAAEKAATRELVPVTSD